MVERIREDDEAKKEAKGEREVNLESLIDWILYIGTIVSAFYWGRGSGYNSGARYMAAEIRDGLAKQGIDLEVRFTSSKKPEASHLRIVK